MRLRSVIDAWNRFFFTPASPLPIAVFRILYSSVVIATLILLHHDWFSWYGTHSWVSLATMQQVEPGRRLNLFTVIPQNDNWIEGLFWFALASAIFLLLGFLTRISAASVFLCVASIQQRNLFITHGGDTFLRVAGFFLIFAPAGAALSVDRLIRLRRGRAQAKIPLSAPWAQRMIQIQLALVYFMSFWWKSLGHTWVDGTALYYVIHLDEIRRFPIPNWVGHPLIIKLGSWFTLALEFALGTLIWIKEFRYPLLLLGVLFHLSIEYALNIPMFQWDVLCAYVLFVDPADIERMRDRILERLHGRAREARAAQLTPESAHCDSAAPPRISKAAKLLTWI